MKKANAFTLLLASAMYCAPGIAIEARPHLSLPSVESGEQTAAQQNVRFDPLPAQALFDAPVKIRLTGLKPNQRAEVKSSARDGLGNYWNAQATFLADQEGVIDLSRQEPVSGSYRGVDPMGLFWSRVMSPKHPEESFDAKAHKTNVMTFSAEVDGETIAPIVQERLFLSAGIKQVSVKEDGLVGQFYTSNESTAAPAIIVLGGSGGGLLWSREVASLLASHGYNTLALAYFGLPGLPPRGEDIRVEYFETAIRWLQQHPSVSGQPIGVWGVSRGGELALLLGATYPDLKAVVAYAPSAVLWGAVGNIKKPTWRYKGSALPFLPDISTPEGFEALKLASSLQGSSRDYFTAFLSNAQAVNNATIPVERINGPILLVSGVDDLMWPSTDLAEIAMDRLAKHSFGFRYEHLRYKDAGHYIAWPNRSTTTRNIKHNITGRVMPLGGTPKGDAYASADAWIKMLAFFKQSFEVRR